MVNKKLLATQAEMAQNGRIMGNEAKFMMMNTKNLLDLNTILAEKFKSEHSAFSVKAVTTEVISLLEIKAQTKSIEIVIV